MFQSETLKNVNLKTRSSVERNCIILVMKLLALNSLLVVRVERGVRWLARGGSGGFVKASTFAAGLTVSRCRCMFSGLQLVELPPSFVESLQKHEPQQPKLGECTEP